MPGGTRWRTTTVGVVAAGDGVGEAERELGVGAAADRHEDPPDLLGAALLDDGDVARRLADDLVDGRREDRSARAVAAAGGAGRPSRR